MRLSVQECLGHIRHTLGGETSDLLQPISILNQAGRHLVGMAPWAWLQRPVVSLDMRGDVTFSNGSSASGSTSLTISGLTSYTFLEGDYVQLTGGTGVTPSFIRIVSQAGTTIVLETAPQTSGGAVSNIAGTVLARSMRLPSDFRKIISITPTDGLISAFYPTDLATISRLRTNTVVVGALRYYGAVTYGQDITANSGPQVPRLEIYPGASANASDALKMVYLAGWADISSDTVNVPVPDHVQALYIRLVRAFARGYEEEDVASLDVRLEEIHRGRVFKDALEQDGETEGTLGQMQGGLAQYTNSRPINYIDAVVGGP